MNFNSGPAESGKLVMLDLYAPTGVSPAKSLKIYF